MTINAIEISRNSYPPVLVNSEGKLNYISQRDIYRIRTEGREIILDTADESYVVKGPMSRFDEELDSERFFRISIYFIAGNFPGWFYPGINTANIIMVTIWILIYVYSVFLYLLTTL